MKISRLNGMISEIMIRKNLRGNFGNFCMNNLTKFDLYIDIILIVYMF